MSQEFNGSVGDVAGRDVVNNNIASSRALTKIERRKLHNLVKKLEDDYGEPGAKTWKSIHDILGVDNIEFMRLEQYKPAETILNLLIDKARLSKEAHHDDKKEGDDAPLRQQLDQSANALTKLTERNGELGATLKKYLQAYPILETKSKKQAGEIEGLSSQLEAALEKLKRIPAAQTSIATARKRFAIAAIVLTLTSASTVALGIQNFALSQSLEEAQGRLNVCEFDDRPFAVGSVLDYEGGADLKCIIVHPGMAPQWGSVTQKSGRAVTKIYHRPNPEAPN